MLSKTRAGFGKAGVVATLLELAACGVALGLFGCSSGDTSAPPGAATQNQHGSALCGNGAVDPGEVCDGALLQNATCASATNGAFPMGNLACAPGCANYDESGCMNASGMSGPPPPPPPSSGGSTFMPPPGSGGSVGGVIGGGGATPIGGGGITPIGGGGVTPIGGGGTPVIGGMPGIGGTPVGMPAPQGNMDPQIPAVKGDCPMWGNTTITYMGLAGIQIAAGPKPAGPTAPMLIYWHGTGSTSGEFALMAAPVANGVTAAGGVIVSFQGTTGGDLNSGTFIFGASDLDIIDQMVACAVRDHGIDPRKIYTMGCSAGGLMSAATAALRSSYIAAAAPNSGGFPVLVPAFQNGHTAPLMTVHGMKGADVVVIDFADASALADMTFKMRGGFVIDCDTGGGHCGGAPLAGDVWTFFQAHPFGVSPEPWTSLPPGFSSQCKIQ
jgi:predicted esterase